MYAINYNFDLDVVERITFEHILREFLQKHYQREIKITIHYNHVYRSYCFGIHITEEEAVVEKLTGKIESFAIAYLDKLTEAKKLQAKFEEIRYEIKLIENYFNEKN